MRNIIKIFLLTVAPLLTACETDSYRTGDGALSAMRAEFVEAHTDADARVMAVETDGGERLTLTGGWRNPTRFTARYFIIIRLTAMADNLRPSLWPCRMCWCRRLRLRQA